MGNSMSNHVFPTNESTTGLKNNRKFILGIIDVQNDFCKDGALAVTDADLVVAPINKLRFACFNKMETFLSQDFHPEDHVSFCTRHKKPALTELKLQLTVNGDILNINQILWAPHCIKDTKGSDFHKDLIRTISDLYIKKGQNKDVESYSAFGDSFNNTYENTKLNKLLASKKITDIILTGIATDYCVYHTALDALRYGFVVHLILSCTKGVSLESTTKALEDMKRKGVVMHESVDDFYDYYKGIKV